MSEKIQQLQALLADNKLDDAIKLYEFESPTVSILTPAPTDEIKEAVIKEAATFGDLERYRKSAVLFEKDYDVFNEPINQEGIESLELLGQRMAGLYDVDDLKENVGKSIPQVAAEFEYGVSVYERLKRENPDNPNYQIPGATVNIKTGQIVLPSLTEDEALKIAENQPYFNQPKFLKLKEQNYDKYRNEVVNQYKDLIQPAYEPGTFSEFGKSFSNFFKQSEIAAFGLGTFDLMVNAVDTATWFLKGKPEEYTFISDGYYDNAKNYSKSNPFIKAVVSAGVLNNQIQKQAKIEHNLKLQTDDSYRARNEWIESTPFWSNFFKDSSVLLRGLGDIAPSLLTSFGTAATAFKGAKVLGYSDDVARKISRKATFATTTLLEGGGYTSAALSDLMTDTPISEETYLKNVNDFIGEIFEEFVIVNPNSDILTFKNKQNQVDLTEKTRLSSTEFNNRVSEYINENYYNRNNMLYQKGMSARDALDTSMLGAVVYSQVAAVLENISTFKVAGYFDNKWGKSAISSALFKSTYRKIADKIRRVPGTDISKVLKLSDSRFTKVIKSAGVEGSEEVMQELSQAVIAGGVPGLKYKDELDINANQLLDSFALGAFGGAIFSGINSTFEFSRDFLISKNFTKKPPVNVQFSAAKLQEGTDKGKYGIFINVNGETAQLTRENSPLFDEDSSIYTNFRAANKARRRLQIRFEKEKAVEIARLRPDLIGAEVGPVRRNDDGVKVYDIVKDGKVVETIEMLKNETNRQFQNRRKNNKSNLNILNENIKKANIEEKTADKVISEDQIIPPESTNKQEQINSLILKTIAGKPVEENEIDLENELAEQGEFEGDKYIRNIKTAVTDKKALSDLINEGVSQDELLARMKDNPGIPDEDYSQIEQLIVPPADLDIRPPEENLEITPEQPSPSVQTETQSVEKLEDIKYEVDVDRKSIDKIIQKNASKGDLNLDQTTNSSLRSLLLDRIEKNLNQQYEKINNFEKGLLDKYGYDDRDLWTFTEQSNLPDKGDWEMDNAYVTDLAKEILNSQDLKKLEDLIKEYNNMMPLDMKYNGKIKS